MLYSTGGKYDNESLWRRAYQIVMYVTSQMDFNPHFRSDEKTNVIDERLKAELIREIDTKYMKSYANQQTQKINKK